MKLSKGETAILLCAALFIAFTAGWFLRGAGTSEPLQVETERTLTAAVTALPAPTPVPSAPPVDLNTATAEELMGLPGIGEKRAADIIADREANGPYTFPEQITRVKGIGEETVAELLEYVTVSGGNHENTGGR